MFTTVSTVLMAAALGGSVGCSQGDEPAQGSEENLTSEPCAGAKLDANGTCRLQNGQFAKKTCCECSGIGSPSWTFADIVPSGFQATPVVRLDAQGQPLDT